jgi:hypothetical protein
VVDKIYSNNILENLKGAVIGREMSFDFSHLIGNRYIETKKLHKGTIKNQLTLMNFM